MDNFLKRKKDVLAKLDKSSKKSWDKKILDLCLKINSSENYYTTSSCSGRVVLMLDEEKKQRGLFIKIYHNKISLEELKKDLVLCSHENKQIKFKLEPCILHVACRDLNCAQKLFDKAKFVGWKKSGIITAKNHIILELNSTERLEFPIISLGEILVDDKFLKIIVKETNRKLEKSWEKIEKLEMAINNYSTKNKNL
jgi:tRNA wybutosine-synthesizing protein 3